tara:strand:- start:354 stop:596 length:243 start_codon:yes stop_codon:yes gene_type:complete
MSEPPKSPFKHDTRPKLALPPDAPRVAWGDSLTSASPAAPPALPDAGLSGSSSSLALPDGSVCMLEKRPMNMGATWTRIQ